MGFTYDWFTNNIVNWAGILHEFKNKPNLEFLEIGSFEGMSTTWLLANILTNSTSKITCVDTFAGGGMEVHTGQTFEGLFPAGFDLEAAFKENVNRWLKLGQVDILKGQSKDILIDIKDKQFDFVYVDGSHLAKDVLLDTLLSWRLLKKGGIIIFDDYEWNGYPKPELNPKIAIDAFLDTHSNDLTILLKSYQVAVRKL